jgi:hypothetical protein
MCFSPQVSIGVGVVWMLAETDVKRFLKRFFDGENAVCAEKTLNPRGTSLK